MDQKDRLAFEMAMAMLRDVREDCLRSLGDELPMPLRTAQGEA